MLEVAGLRVGRTLKKTMDDTVVPSSILLGTEMILVSISVVAAVGFTGEVTGNGEGGGGGAGGGADLITTELCIKS